MSEEEKQAAEAVNAKYDTTEQKLNEKATDEAYDIAGSLLMTFLSLTKMATRLSQMVM